MATHLVKIKLDGDLRIMEIPSPPRFDGLVKAVTEAYSIPAGKERGGLAFTYKDSDGDEVRFDTDAELDLAIRTSSVPLRIMVQNTASSKASSPPAAAGAGAASFSSSPRSPLIPSTPGFAVASNVGSVLGGEDAEDMIMVDMPSQAVPMGSSGGMGGGGGGSSGGGGESGASPKEKEDIDAPAAFEAEAAAARDPEGSALYQKASIRLAKRFKVHLTPTQLWRVLALLQIQGRQLITFGLAPHRTLDPTANSSASASGGASSDDEEEGEGADASAQRGRLKRSKSRMARGAVADPVQRVLALNGVELPEEEVQPLLEALHVRPKRLVRLGLLPPEILDDLPEENREGKGSRVGPQGHRMHGHGPGGRGGRGGGGRGRGPMPFRAPPPFHDHPHHHHDGGFGPYGGGGGRHPSHHGPPPHMGGMRAPQMHPPHGHGHSHRGHPHPPPGRMHGEAPHEEGGGDADWRAPGGRHPPPPPHHHPHAHHMWQHGGPGYDYSGYAGYGGGPGGGYGFGYGGGGGGGGGWGAWAHPYGPPPPRAGAGGGRGGGAGGGAKLGPKSGFGKGTKDNMAMARFVSHPSGSDVTKVAAGQTFKKSWLVRNDSTTTWPEACSLVPVSQSCADLSAPPEAPIVGDVSPGEEATVSVDLVAPSQPGMYEGYWRGRDSEGRRFGQRLWAKVMVVAPGEDMNAAVERLSLDNNGNKDN